MLNRLISSPNLLTQLPFVVLTLMLCVLATSAHAVPVNDLYVADVLVIGEGADQLKSGARAGLLQVLVRVSGSEKVEDSALIRSALDNPAAYYYQFSYESSEQLLVVNVEQFAAKVLRLKFDPAGISNLLREANFPVWGSNRPSVLLWVALRDEQSRRLVAEADSSDLVASLIDQARHRGLPVQFPILDLEDATAITAAEVWGAFLDRVENASERYSPDSILTGRIQQNSAGRWSGSWSYKIGDNWGSVERSSFSADELARDIIGELANELADRYALGSTRNNVKIVVEGVKRVSDYGDLSRYLSSLTPVVHSTIVQLQDDVATFELQTEGEYDQLIEIIELDQRLILLNQNERTAKLLYRWRE